MKSIPIGVLGVARFQRMPDALRIEALTWLDTQAAELERAGAQLTDEGKPAVVAIVWEPGGTVKVVALPTNPDDVPVSVVATGCPEWLWRWSEQPNR
jgi:hypothetical protein